MVIEKSKLAPCSVILNRLSIFWGGNMEENTLSQAEFYDTQAFACNASKEYKEALNYYIKSLKIKQEIFGAEHQEVAIACSNIAVIYENLLQYGAALNFYERALQICHAACLEDRTEIYRLYSYIGNLYGRLGDYNKSYEFLEKALTQSEEDLGEHVETAKIYSYMASLYKNTKEYESALSTEEKALWIYEEVLGDEHHYTLGSYQSLFRIYLYLKNRDKADEMAEKLLVTHISCFGENSREVFECLYDIANSCFMAKEYTRALETFHKILSLKDVSAPKLMEIYNAMGRIYQELNDSIHTFEYFMKAAELAEEARTAEAATICNNIATYFCDHEHYKEAILLHKKALKVREEVHGKIHPTTAHSLNNLAFACSKLRDYETTLKLYRKTLEIRLATLGDLHDDTIISVRNIAYTYSEVKQYDAALEFYEKILELQIKKHGAEHSETAHAMLNVGIINYNLKNYQVAMQYYEQALMLAKKLQNPQLANEILHFKSLL